MLIYLLLQAPAPAPAEFASETQPPRSAVPNAALADMTDKAAPLTGIRVALQTSATGTPGTAAAPSSGDSRHASLPWLPRADLQNMKTSELRKRAVSTGIGAAALDVADDAEDTKAVIIELLLQDGHGDRKVVNPVEHALRIELSDMKRSALRKRALQEGVPEALLEEADDASDTRVAIVDLILAQMRLAVEKVGRAAQVEAATKMQAVQRGRVARRHTQQLRTERHMQTDAARKMQAIQRGRQGRKYAQKIYNQQRDRQSSAAAKIRAQQRARQARRQVQEIREARGKYAAAQRLQARRRGQQGRRRAQEIRQSHEKHAAAAKLQTRQRGRQARKHVRKIREEREMHAADIDS